jgi:hypothetical protein
MSIGPKPYGVSAHSRQKVTSGDGDIVDLQLIVGGTGALRASGTFVAGSGESKYIGSICLP